MLFVLVLPPDIIPSRAVRPVGSLPHFLVMQGLEFHKRHSHSLGMSHGDAAPRKLPFPGLLDKLVQCLVGIPLS